MNCSWCRQDFDVKQGRVACRHCALFGGCRKVKCPHCGYEMPEEPRVLQVLGRMLGGGRRGDNERTRN